MRGPKKLNVPEGCQESIITIRTLIIMDYMGGGGETPEEEAKMIADTFEAQHNIILNYDFAEFAHHVNDKEYKLVIMDYGGLLPGSDDTIANALRVVTKWAEEHPSRLVVFWTMFTSRFWDWEIKDEFEDLANVLFYDPANEHGSTKYVGLEELFEHQDKIIMTIRTLLG